MAPGDDIPDDDISDDLLATNSHEPLRPPSGSESTAREDLARASPTRNFRSQILSLSAKYRLRVPRSRDDQI